MAKNWSQGVTAAETQVPIERMLQDLVAKHKTILGALDALAVDEHLHELVSRERVLELKKLLISSQQQIEDRLGEQQEVIFYLARFIESWCTAHDTKIDTVEVALTSISQQLARGFSQTHTNQEVIVTKLDELLSRTPDARQLGAGPVPAALQANEPLSENTASVPAILADQLCKLMLEKSRLLLNWPATVGAGHHRITPGIEAGLVTSVTSTASSTNLVLGPKGAGKSAMVSSIANLALASGFAILGIRADEMPAEMISSEDFQEFLHMTMPVADAVRTVAGKYPVLILIDQLDAVSELIDRRSNRLNLLLDLIRDLAGTRNVHILAACREFDYRHDARLSSIGTDEVRVALPDWTEVASVLLAEGWMPESMGEPMRELLKTPWHLNLFLKVARKGEEFSSLQSLIEAVWAKCVTNAEGLDGRQALVERIALYMSENEELFVPVAISDQASAERDALLREEILISEGGGRRLAFRHQTFYDYTLARLFSVGGQSLAGYVLQRQDGLFVRLTMLSGLELLRDASRNRYLREVRQIFGANPRAHLRALLIEFLARQQDPDDQEVGILAPLLMSGDGPLILRTAAGSRGWFRALSESGELAAWMRQPSARAGLCIGFLIEGLRFSTDAVYDLVVACWSSDPAYDELIATLIGYLQKWDECWLQLACLSVRRSAISIFFTASRIVKTNPDIAVKLVRAQLDSEYEMATAALANTPPTSDDSAKSAVLREYLAARENPFTKLIDSRLERGHYSLGVIAEKAPRAYLELVLPWFIDVLAQMPPGHRAGQLKYRDDPATEHAYETAPNQFVESLHKAADGWAKHDPATFVAFVESVSSVEFVAVHRVLVQALCVAATTNASAGAAYLIGDPRRFVVGTFSDIHRFSKRLLAGIFPHLDPNHRFELESALVHFDAFGAERRDGHDAQIRFEMIKWNRQYRLRLLRALPSEFTSVEVRTLIESEERLLPGTENLDHVIHDFSHLGPLMTGEQLLKASNENIFKALDQLYAVGGNDLTQHLDARPNGGIREQSNAFGALAASKPERVLSLLKIFSVARADHQLYAGAIVGGLAKSTYTAANLFSIIHELDADGFSGDEFREAVADAVQERIKRKEIVPTTMLTTLEAWLEKMETPLLSENGVISTGEKYVGPIVLGHGAMFSLNSGRGSIFRAIELICQTSSPVQAMTLICIAGRRVGREKHPKVIAEILLYLHTAFTQKETLVAATKVFGDLIDSCPAVMEHGATLHALARLTGHFQPPERFQEWLSLLSRSPEQRQRQAYGEILFLYYGRRSTPWAGDQIARGLLENNEDFVRGAAYGAAQNWTLPHCRQIATDILCAAAQHSAKEFGQIMESAFFLTEDETFPVDAETRRVIRAVCDNPANLRAAGAQILEAIARVAGTQPDLVLHVSRAVMAAAEGDVAKLYGQLGDMASNLTSIAITLHRQDPYRAPGLELFESLLSLGVAETAAALELLDRKAYQIRPLVVPIRRPRRLKRKAD
jgi:hypothetical protein